MLASQPSPSPSASSAPSSSSGDLSTGALVGMSVAITFVVMGLCGYWFYWYRKRVKSRFNSKAGPDRPSNALMEQDRREDEARARLERVEAVRKEAESKSATGDVAPVQNGNAGNGDVK